MSEVTWTAPVAGGPVDALVRVPGSKSLTARWMMLAAIADAPTALTGVLVSRDTRLMRDALERLGATLSVEGEALRVTPIPPPAEHAEGPVEIHTGLAGTVMRFVPLLAALHHGDVSFTGDESALLRPMAPAIQALRSLGVEVTETGEPGHLPFVVHGRGCLAGGSIDVDASASSQFISNLLLVGARCEKDLRVRHVGDSLPSLPHIEMTMTEMRRAGIDVSHSQEADGTHVWTVRSGPIAFGDVRIEPDLSNAGPFLAAALVAGGEIEIADWPRRTDQPGDAFRTLLSRMGGEFWREDEDVCVRGTGVIHGVDADLSATGELTPTIAALAALADSPSHLRGIKHLRGHETDRIHALATELSKLGCRTVEHEGSLEIHPGPLTGCEFETYQDHRMATAGAIIGLRVPDVRVVDVATTQKTLPDFVGMWLAMLHTDEAGEAR
ncbi:3-phosphoshikimate 1-carboxyvinyltransferase [Brachybacterium subflavum]|uniref:3-phosphoshikimate 1-carboxyvinyltransferase n=1 Tax=Brachybacterium subflavum TaxID=2585206 RepID=UPI001266788B|nr:3-phosphoshikimate 1-carboxyvinyltransferase [Brachybacterium subflavum]